MLSGRDTEGHHFKRIEDIWSSHLEDEWYSKGAQYWMSVDSNVEGMLGGFGCISTIDVAGSAQFLAELKKGMPHLQRRLALDCGAGIGRVTRDLLCKFFEKVDLVDQNPKFIEEAKVQLQAKDNIENFFVSGLQDFEPQPNRYDVIWIQWVVGQLQDDHFVGFLQKCQKALAPNGSIVVKDNVSRKGFIIDNEDSSVTRSRDHMVAIFRESGLKIVKEKTQEGFPRELFPVIMFALQTASS